MPHAVVDYSDSLTDSFDRRAFALELHVLAVEMLETSIATCTTRFHRLEESVVGNGAVGRAVVHVERHTAKAADPVIHASVDVRDLGEAHTKSGRP
ncbi:isomerase [Streptomyces sp. NPDC048257]|uniref:isomerase n=1 Tax=Streptomyces sp. NPDC048257 TaxID=3365526 RepID=UPI003718F919